MTSRSSTMATRRVGSPAGWQAASPVSSAQRPPPPTRGTMAACPPVGAVGGLQDDLGAPAQVEPEPGRLGDRQPAGRTDQQQDGDKTPPEVTRHDCGTSSVN